MNYRILRGARRDIDGVEKRLEDEHVGYGIAWLEEVRDAIRAIRSNPLSFPKSEDAPRGVPTREYFVRRFKYRIIYFLEIDEVLIVSAQHASRKPRSWHRRLRDRNP